jgi:hypothetical protein
MVLYSYEDPNNVSLVKRMQEFDARRQQRQDADMLRAYTQQKNDLALAQAQQDLQQSQSGFGQGIPATVQEWNTYQKITDPREKDLFLSSILQKRGSGYSAVQLGDRVGAFNKDTGQIEQMFGRGVAPRYTTDAAGRQMLMGGGMNAYQDPQTDAAIEDFAATPAPQMAMAPQQRKKANPPVYLGNGEYGFIGENGMISERGHTDKTAMTAYRAALAQQNNVENFQQKEQSKVAMNLPNLETSVQSSLDVLDKALNHPALNAVTGNPLSLSKVRQGALPGDIQLPGSSAADARAILGQIKGKAFLAAFEGLRGGGAITEIEGQKATDAIAALNTNQSPEAMRQSLMELRGIISKGMQNAYLKAGQQPTQYNQPMPVNAPAQQVRRRYNPSTGDFE